MVHPGNDSVSVNLFDLMKHNGYYLIIIAALLIRYFPKEDPYENWVIFLDVVFIGGVLSNCFLFNLEGDRDFHWYSVALIFLSFGAGMKKAWPDRYYLIVSRIPGYNRGIRIYKWICQITK